MATVTDTIDSYRDNARACTYYRLTSSDPNVPQFQLAISDLEAYNIKQFPDYPSPEDQLWMKRKQWEIDNKVWKDKQVPYGNPYSTYPVYTSGSSAGPVTITYDNSTQQAYMPVQLVPAPAPEPKEETPFEWLDREVNEIREMAWAA